MDHPSNTKRDGLIQLQSKCSLPLKVIEISYLQDWINFEIKIGDKTCNFVSLQRSPSHKNEFQNFIKNFELILNKIPFLIVVLGDFNARMRGWYQKDIKTFKESKIDTATSQSSLNQKTKEPTCILTNLASYIDLIYISQPSQ